MLDREERLKRAVTAMSVSKEYRSMSLKSEFTSCRRWSATLATSRTWLLLCAAIFLNASASAADARLYSVEVRSGKEFPVCGAYAKAIESSAFLRPANCGRWDLAHVANIKSISSKEFSAEEYKREYPYISKFLNPPSPAPNYAENARLDELRSVERYEQWYSLQSGSEPPLGRFLVLFPRPAQWIKEINAGGSRMVLWEDNAMSCGEFFSTSDEAGSVAGLRNHLLFVSQTGAVDAAKTNLLYAKKSSVAESSSSLWRKESFGLFRYDEHVFVDAIYSEKLSAMNDDQLALAVLELNQQPLQLRKRCDLVLSPRPKPWKFAK
jgi:hypothetical protein